MPKLHWYEGENLRDALTRWVEKTEYAKLVWYVKDDEGDEIDIPISSNHTFTGSLEDTLKKIKRAYATTPMNPILLDFIIKQGNKTVIVANAGVIR